MGRDDTSGGDLRTLRIDLHVHSEDSYDGHDPVELLLEHAAEIGLDAIVVTDHDTMDESRRAAELAADYGLVGIPGVEISTAAGHLLGIGIDSMPEPGLPLAEAIDWVEEHGGAAIVPHPFQRSRHGVRKRRLLACDATPDALEVYNSMLFTGYRNRRAASFAAARDYPIVGGSDAHYVPNVGRAYTEVDVPVPSGTSAHAIDTETVVEAIRAGETGVRGERTPIPKSALQYASGTLRKASYELTSRLPYVPAWPVGYTSSN